MNVALIVLVVIIGYLLIGCVVTAAWVAWIDDDQTDYVHFWWLPFWPLLVAGLACWGVGWLVWNGPMKGIVWFVKRLTRVFNPSIKEWH